MQDATPLYIIVPESITHKSRKLLKCSGKVTMKMMLILILISFVGQLPYNPLFSPAFAADASGSIQGAITCTGSSIKHKSSFVFSAFVGFVPVYGNWEASFVDDLSNTSAIIGYLGEGTIAHGNFNLEGTVTSDSVCGASVPSQVTVTGFCGALGKLQIVSGNDWRGEFEGNIECTG